MNSKKPLEFQVQDLTSSWHRDGILGNGTFGIVRLCKHERLGFVAVKCIKTDGSIEDKSAFSKSFIKEVQIGYGKKHQNILEIYGIVEWKPNCVGIVSEFAEYKDLQSLFLKGKIKVAFGLRLQMMLEINAGAAYFHTLDKPVVHKDLKLQNILLSHGLHVKIADFGAARLVQTAGSSAITGNHQWTLGYTAPEILKDTRIPPAPMQDMFSIALVMYEMVTNKYAMDGVPIHLIIESIKDGQRPQKIQILKDNMGTEHKDYNLVCSLEEIITSCWDGNPKERLTANEVSGKLQILIDDRTNFGQEVDAEVKRLSSMIKHNKTIDPNEAVCLNKFSHPFEEVPENRRPPTPRNPPRAPGTKASSVLNVPVVERNDNEMPLGAPTRFAPTERPKDSLVLTGGQATMTTVMRYIADKKRWKQLPDLKEGRCHHNSVIVQDKLFVIGGVNKAKVLNSVECLDMKEMGSWSVLKGMIECRYQASAEVLRENIYVFGGKNGSDEGLNTIECFSTSMRSSDWNWSIFKTKLPGRRFNFSTFLIPERDVVYCCGGMDYKNPSTNVVEAINLETGACETDQLDQSRCGACAVKANINQFLLLGGLDADGAKATNTVSCFKIGDEKWKSSKDMKMKRCAFACGIIDTTVYAVGGHGENEKLSAMSTLERIDLSEKDPEWQIVTPHMDRQWAGHSVVVW